MTILHIYLYATHIMWQVGHTKMARTEHDGTVRGAWKAINEVEKSCGYFDIHEVLWSVTLGDA